MTWKKIEVVMTATEDNNAPVGEYRDTKNLSCRVNHDIARGANQHLHITSYEEIKEGDWCYNISKHIISNDSYAKDNQWKKIIASTDPKLRIEFQHDSDGLLNYPFPQIPQQFIELFCKLGGKGEFEVECCRTMDGTPTYNRVLVNPDNTINIRQVEEKVYSRDEVLMLLFKLRCHLLPDKQTVEIRSWVKDNLK